MPKVIYVGPHTAVEVPMPNGSVALVERDGVLETTGDHAAGLLEQPSNWQPEKKAAAPKPASKSADPPSGEKG